jgi:hypothetical protein
MKNSARREKFDSRAWRISAMGSDCFTEMPIPFKGRWKLYYLSEQVYFYTHSICYSDGNNVRLLNGSGSWMSGFWTVTLVCFGFNGVRFSKLSPVLLFESFHLQLFWERYFLIVPSRLYKGVFASLSSFIAQSPPPPLNIQARSNLALVL